MGKGEPFQQMILGKLDMHTQKNEVGPLPYTAYHIDQRTKNMKLLNESTGVSFMTLDFAIIS